MLSIPRYNVKAVQDDISSKTIRMYDCVTLYILFFHKALIPENWIKFSFGSICGLHLQQINVKNICFLKNIFMKEKMNNLKPKKFCPAFFLSKQIGLLFVCFLKRAYG